MKLLYLTDNMYYRMWSDNIVAFDPTDPPFLPPYPSLFPIPARMMKEMFLFRDVQGDGQCFFRAIALGYQENEKYHARVKARMLEWMVNDTSAIHEYVKNRFSDKDEWETFKHRLQHSRPTMNPDEWGADCLTPIAEAVFDIRIFVWKAPRHGNGSYECYRKPYLQYCTNKPPKKVLHLLNQNNVHYLLLEPNKFYVGPSAPRFKRHKSIDTVDLVSSL